MMLEFILSLFVLGAPPADQSNLIPTRPFLRNGSYSEEEASALKLRFASVLAAMGEPSLFRDVGQPETLRCTFLQRTTPALAFVMRRCGASTCLDAKQLSNIYLGTALPLRDPRLVMARQRVSSGFVEGIQLLLAKIGDWANAGPVAFDPTDITLVADAPLWLIEYRHGKLYEVLFLDAGAPPSKEQAERFEILCRRLYQASNLRLTWGDQPHFMNAKCD